jgi:6-phosphogluconolactonase (cycloisomerase 2 family)
MWMRKSAVILVSLAAFAACGGPPPPVARARFVYALADSEYLGENRYSDASIAGFRVNPASGTLTTLVDSPFDQGVPASTFTVHPSGSYLYLSSNPIMGIAIDPSTGRLLGPVPGSPAFAYGYQLLVSPDGQSLYGANGNYFGLAGFHVDASTGALTPLPGSPFAPALGPLWSRNDAPRSRRCV